MQAKNTIYTKIKYINFVQFLKGWQASVASVTVWDDQFHKTVHLSKTTFSTSYY